MSSERLEPHMFVVDIGRGGAPCWRYVAAYSKTAVASAYGINLYVAEERTLELAYCPKEIDLNLCNQHTLSELRTYFKSKEKQGRTYVDEGFQD